MVASIENLFPPSHFFKFGNRMWAYGAKSREYGGCGINSNDKSCNFAIVLVNVE